MPSKIALLADAVKTSLNTGTFSQTFTAERKYIPAKSLEELETAAATDAPVVIVVARSNEIENLSRVDRQKTVDIGIGVQKRLTQACDPGSEDGNAELDATLLFVEEIAAHFTPGEYGGALWVATKNDPIYDQEDLTNNRTFASMVIVTFKYL